MTKTSFTPLFYYNYCLPYDLDKIMDVVHPEPRDRASYIPKVCAKRRYEINAGYHSFRSMFNFQVLFSTLEKMKVGIFIIPKGAIYYQNKSENVSSTLIYKGPFSWRRYFSLLLSR